MLIAGSEPDIIMITEVLPKIHCNSISAAQLALSGYQAFFNFDPKNPSSTDYLHGVAIYISNKLPASEVLFSKYFQEQIWLTLKLRGHDNLLVGCLYQSPSSDIQQSTAFYVIYLNLSVDTPMTTCLICGDFNYPDINWSLSSCSIHNPELFLNTVQNLFFQHVSKPTRYRSDSTPHILDIIFTTEESMVNDVKYLPGLGSSDHICICLQFELACYCDHVKRPRPRYNVYKADFNKTRSLLEAVTWDDFLNPLDIYSAWNLFVSKLSSILDECIPLDIPKSKKSLFLNTAALRIKNMKCKLWKKYMTTKSPLVYQQYCNVRSNISYDIAMTRSLRRDYEYKLASNHNNY